jgi:regulator of cell morphogenesis and NO signaling
MKIQPQIPPRYAPRDDILGWLTAYFQGSSTKCPIGKKSFPTGDFSRCLALRTLVFSFHQEVVSVIDSATTLRNIALSQPAAIRVFERFGLDYCCGGNRPLTTACAEKGLDMAVVLSALAETADDAPPERDLTQISASELIGHIVGTHHAYIRRELPRLEAMAVKVAEKHGPRHPEILEIQSRLQMLGEDLLQHLHKEEMILFPYIQSVERSRDGQGDMPHACFGSVESPIRMMIHEHETAAALLEQMRALSGEFAPPPDACPTFVGFYDGLAAFERDLHRHVHLENNLLFPQAIEMEQGAQLSR